MAPSTHLPSDRLLAGSADALGNGRYSQLVQVGLETSQHGVQLAARFGGCGRRGAAAGFPLRHELQGRENSGCKASGAALAWKRAAVAASGSSADRRLLGDSYARCRSR